MRNFKIVEVQNKLISTEKLNNFICLLIEINLTTLCFKKKKKVEKIVTLSVQYCTVFFKIDDRLGTGSGANWSRCHTN